MQTGARRATSATGAKTSKGKNGEVIVEKVMTSDSFLSREIKKAPLIEHDGSLVADISHIPNDLKITIQGAREHNLKNVDLAIPRNRMVVLGHARAKSVPRIPEHTTKFERLFDGVSGRKTEPEYAKFRTISGPKRKSRPPRYSGRPALTSISPAGLAYHEVYTVLGHQSLSMNTVRTWPRNSSYLPVPAWASPYAPSS